MQKKLIALAVAAVVTAPAFAQSNVTIYGRLDLGYSYWGSNVDSDVGNRNAIDSNGQKTSFLGFKGAEDLGNGLKAGFDMQYRLNPDQGNFDGTGSRRDVFVYLNGGFGTVALGRLTHFQDSLLTSVDPFGASNLTGYGGSWTQGANLVGLLANEATASSVGDGGRTTRLDNVIAYISPNFSGLTVKAAFTKDGIGNESKGNEANLSATSLPDAQVWAISPVYQNGPLTVGANYHEVELQSAQVGVDGIEEKVWDLAAAYDFGMVKLSAAYGQDKLTAAGENLKVKQWFVGASAPVGAAGKVALVYGQNEIDNESNSDTTRWALGYTHNLSKRTSVYAEYVDYDYEENGLGGIGKVGLGNSDGYERGLGVGLVHTF